MDSPRIGRIPPSAVKKSGTALASAAGDGAGVAEAALTSATPAQPTVSLRSATVYAWVELSRYGFSGRI